MMIMSLVGGRHGVVMDYHSVVLVRGPVTKQGFRTQQKSFLGFGGGLRG